MTDNAMDALEDTQDSQESRVFTREELAKITNAQVNKATSKLQAEYEAKLAEAEARAAKTNDSVNSGASPVGTGSVSAAPASANQDASQDMKVNAALSQAQSDKGSALTREEVASIVTQIMNETKQNQYFQDTARAYYQNLAVGRGKYQDFDDVTKSYSHTDNDGIAFLLANEKDHAADVVYHLAKNPKVARKLNALALSDGEMAADELKSLINSIKANETAKKNTRFAREPLSDMNPKNSGASGGKPTMEDLRRKFRY